MRTIIAGSRSVHDMDSVLTAVLEAPWVPTLIISGTARGADQLGSIFARDFSLPLTRFPADWNRYGKSAGHRREERFEGSRPPGDGMIISEESRMTKKEHRGFFVLSPIVLADCLPLPADTKITGARWDEMTRRILVFVEHPDLSESYEGLPVQESHVMITRSVRESEPGDMIVTDSAKWN